MTSRLNSQNGELFRPDDDTDTSSSSRSLPDDRHVTLILDIHDIKKGGEKPDSSVLSKVKKLRKKKKSTRNHSPTNDSSSSPSETTTTSRTDTALEKFYDAHGSLHALAENPIDATQPVDVPAAPLPILALQPVLPTTIAQAQSEHGPKVPPLSPAQGQTQSATIGERQVPSKPTVLPETKSPD